jgi:DNA primase large subunit
MRRMQHRHAAAREAEDGARSRGGAIAEYYAAFRAIDKTLGDIATLLSQLMLYGEPQEVAMHRASWRRHEEEQRLGVSFKTDGFLRRLNEVVRLDVAVSPLGGLVIVEGYSASFHRHGEHFIGDVHVTGVVLPESA